MMVLFTILTWMSSLAPGRDHATNGTAIAAVVLSEPPLFRDDASRLRTAALITAIAFRESSFRNDVTSATDDFCLMQVHGRPELALDPEACVRVAMAMLRESMRMCPAYPIAFYASGPGACTNARAQRISRDRLALAARLLRDVGSAAATEAVNAPFAAFGAPGGATEGHAEPIRAVCRPGRCAT